MYNISESLKQPTSCGYISILVLLYHQDIRGCKKIIYIRHCFLQWIGGEHPGTK